jgi:hypothetical protein
MRFFGIGFFHESMPNRPLMNVKKQYYNFSRICKKIFVHKV